MKEPPVRTCPIRSACGCVSGTFHWLLIDGGGLSHWTVPTPAGGAGLYNRSSWTWGWKCAVLLRASALVPASMLLPWIPLVDVTYKIKQTLSCPVVFGHGVYRSNRKQIRTAQTPLHTNIPACRLSPPTAKFSQPQWYTSHGILFGGPLQRTNKPSEVQLDAASYLKWAKLQSKVHPWLYYCKKWFYHCDK